MNPFHAHHTVGSLRRPIRRIIPSIAGIDISPLILALLIGFVSRLIIDNLPYY